ncbi:hypothetical protein L3Q82_007799 [Scortum barcoo]|uniref:Uncharacterized protein n=1 Tax=Scortum barcoo TaxID=214431 RepID=A0ACB8WJV4_9TELE|nr:hypothetical protein L3Q82_007799 [Scortum barcoo]
MSLPPHRSSDLLLGAPIPKGCLYSISGRERAAMDEYITTLLKAVIIYPPSLLAGAGFFFVGKKDGFLRPCIDYSPLNDITFTLQVRLWVTLLTEHQTKQQTNNTVAGEPAKSFSCLKTLTGTELLKISHQSSPAEVKVTCFYLNMYPSPESDVSSIIIRTSLPPKLIVNPPVINETDSVTLNCQTPSSVSVSQCYFHIVRGEAARHFSCLKTLTGTELLKMSHKSSPAEVEVMCFYTVKFGETDSPSPHSDTSSITIHSETPQMSLQHFPGEYVLFTCSLPGPANHDTRCNLYFGEASDPVLTKNIWKERSSTKQWFCQFIVTVDYLLSRLRLVQQSDASCDYTLGSSLSPRSDGYNLTDIVEKEVTQDSDYNDIYYDHRYCGKGVTQDSDYNDIYYDHRTDCQLASCVHSCNSCKTNIRLDCWYTKLHWWFYLYCPNISETTIRTAFSVSHNMGETFVISTLTSKKGTKIVASGNLFLATLRALCSCLIVVVRVFCFLLLRPKDRMSVSTFVVQTALRSRRDSAW